MQGFAMFNDIFGHFNQQKLTAKQLAFGRELFDQAGIAPDSHLVLKYDQKNQAKYMHGESGTRKGVMPAGMSGCGMYRFSLLPNTEDHYVVRLIAIFTDYDKRRRVLIGTRLGPLLRAGMLQ